MITRLGRWLCPAFFGPVLALWTAVTISVLLGNWDPKLGKWGSWVLGMIFGTLMGGGIGVILVLVDAALLRWRSRLLPMGGRAWLMGFAAPFLVFAVWHFFRPGDWDGWRLWFAILMPMLAAAVFLRLLFSPRFGRG